MTNQPIDQPGDIKSSKMSANMIYGKNSKLPSKQANEPCMSMYEKDMNYNDYLNIKNLESSSRFSNGEERLACIKLTVHS